MPSFYKGAAVGTYWHQNDARLLGFHAAKPGQTPTTNQMQNHIARGSIFSPYVSLTTSYGVAADYAKIFSRARPSQATPAFVYEIEFHDPLPSGLNLFDPVVHVAANGISPLLNNPYYQHDGDSTFLSAIADPFLSAPVPQVVQFPPGAHGISRSPNLSITLEMFVYALRDSEILAVGNIPAANVVSRWNIY